MVVSVAVDTVLLARICVGWAAGEVRHVEGVWDMHCIALPCVATVLSYSAQYMHDSLRSKHMDGNAWS